MAINQAVRLEGWNELAKALQEIGKNATRNVVKQAMISAAKLVVERASLTREYQDRTGNLRSSVEVRSKKNKSTSVGADVVATSPHGHLIEFGWKQRTGKGVREIPGTYFLTNALQEVEYQVLDKFRTEMYRYMERRIKRAKK